MHTSINHVFETFLLNQGADLV